MLNIHIFFQIITRSNPITVSGRPLKYIYFIYICIKHICFMHQLFSWTFYDMLNVHRLMATWTGQRQHDIYPQKLSVWHDDAIPWRPTISALLAIGEEKPPPGRDSSMVGVYCWNLVTTHVGIDVMIVLRNKIIPGDNIILWAIGKPLKFPCIITQLGNCSGRVPGCCQPTLGDNDHYLIAVGHHMNAIAHQITDHSGAVSSTASLG